MVLWVILIIGWLAVLAAAISLCRLVGYCDGKFRELNGRRRRKEIQSLSPGSADEIFASKSDAAA